MGSTVVCCQYPSLNVRQGKKMQHSKCHLICAEFRHSLSKKWIPCSSSSSCSPWPHQHFSVVTVSYWLLKFWSTNIIKTFHIKCCQIRSFSASLLLDKNKQIYEKIYTFLLNFYLFYPIISFLESHLKSWFGKLLLLGIFHLKNGWYVSSML